MLLRVLCVSLLAICSASRLDIPLYSYAGVQFYAKLDIGTPPQAIIVTPNTAVSDIVVPSADCDRRDPVCYSKDQYQNFYSTSYIGDGTAWSSSNLTNITGYYSIDTVTLADVDRTTIATQTFVEAITVSNAQLAFTRYDGYLGLGIDNIASPNSFLTNLVISGAIDKASFGLFVSNNDSVNSYLSFGGYDPTLFTGNLATHSVQLQPRMMWGVVTWAIKINDNAYSLVCTAVPNPASPQVGLPISYADWLHQELGGVSVSPGQYMFDCDKIHSVPNVSIVIREADQYFEYKLQSGDFITQFSTASGDFCVSDIEGLDSEWPQEVCVLGVPFLKKYYAYFEMYNQELQQPSISFAKSINSQN